MLDYCSAVCKCKLYILIREQQQGLRDKANSKVSELKVAQNSDPLQLNWTQILRSMPSHELDTKDTSPGYFKGSHLRLTAKDPRRSNFYSPHCR